MTTPKPLIPTTPTTQPYYMECTKCGHEVTALPSAKCPECGGPLEPRDIDEGGW